MEEKLTFVLQKKSKLAKGCDNKIYIGPTPPRPNGQYQNHVKDDEGTVK